MADLSIAEYASPSSMPTLTSSTLGITGMEQVTENAPDTVCVASAKGRPSAPEKNSACHCCDRCALRFADLDLFFPTGSAGHEEVDIHGESALERHEGNCVVSVQSRDVVECSFVDLYRLAQSATVQGADATCLKAGPQTHCESCAGRQAQLLQLGLHRL